MMILTVTLRGRLRNDGMLDVTYQIVLYFDCHADNLGEANKTEYFHGIFVCGFGSLSKPFSSPDYISSVYHVARQSLSIGQPLK